MEVLKLRGTKIFYDLDSKIIGRHPTDSNILESGSDNSLYMGLNSNNNSVQLISKIMDLNNINEFSGKSFVMSFYGESVDVQCNVNHEGQLQYKIVKNGKMHELLSKYERNIGPINKDKLLIMMDFTNYEIFFEESDDDVSTASSNSKNKKSKQELNEVVEESKKISDPNVDVNGYIETTLNIRNNYVQRTFRNNLLVEFDGKCAICEINKKELLHASHILPYSKCNSVNEMIDYNNGLLLCVNHDELFDKGFISFDVDSGKLLISNEIDETLYHVLNISKDITLASKYLNDKRKKFLSTHKLK